MPEVVFDTCVVSNFALARAMGVLDSLYAPQGFITDFVAAEVLRGIQAGHERLEDIRTAVGAGRLRQISLEPAERRDFEALSRSLGSGEASSLAAARARGFTLATDDRVARAEAGRLGVRVTGTLGILVKAVRTGVCDTRTADRYLARMIRAGFFSPVRSVRGISLKR